MVRTFFTFAIFNNHLWSPQGQALGLETQPQSSQCPIGFS